MFARTKIPYLPHSGMVSLDISQHEAFVQELNLMRNALENDDIESAKHHQFAALLMLRSLLRRLQFEAAETQNEDTSLLTKCFIVQT